MAETDLEKYVYDDRKDEILMARIISYFSILATMTAFICTCIGLSQSTQASIEQKLYKFPFPYISQFPEVKPGMVVALDYEGKAFTGAGITVSRNVTAVSVDDIDVGNVITCNFGYQVIFAATKGRLRAYEISYEDVSILNEVFDLPVGPDSNPRTVSGMHKMNDNTILIVGSGEILPIGVKVTVQDDKHVKVEIQVGKPVTFTTYEFAYPHSDDFGDDRTLAITYEEADGLYTCVYQIKEGTSGATTELITGPPPKKYSDKYRFHGIAGIGFLNNNYYYAVSAVGSKSTNPNEQGPIRVASVFFNSTTLDPQVLHWNVMVNSSSYGFFDMDNIDRENFVVCYSAYQTDAIVCTHTWNNRGEFVFGSTVNLNSGGAATYFQRMKIVPQNNKTFGLLYQNAEIGGLLTYVLVGLNNALDLAQISPSFVVSQRNFNNPILASYCGVSKVDDYKVAIVEVVKQKGADKDINFAVLHTVYVYPRPVGIASKTFTGKTEIQFGGSFRTSQTLTVGRTYYTNDRGDLLAGPFAGYANRWHGVFYVNSFVDQSLMSVNNMVGIAVTSNELMIKFNRN